MFDATNSNLYMWESPENQIEFENDFIASTSQDIYSQKELQKYESLYFHDERIRERTTPKNLPPGLLTHLRNMYLRFATRNQSNQDEVEFDLGGLERIGGQSVDEFLEPDLEIQELQRDLMIDVRRPMQQLQESDRHVF